MFQKSVPALDTNQMHLISSFWVVCKQGNCIILVKHPVLILMEQSTKETKVKTSFLRGGLFLCFGEGPFRQSTLMTFYFIFYKTLN